MDAFIGWSLIIWHFVMPFMAIDAMIYKAKRNYEKDISVWYFFVPFLVFWIPIIGPLMLTMYCFGNCGYHERIAAFSIWETINYKVKIGEKE